MAFDEWAQATALAIAHEMETIYGNPDRSDRPRDRQSLERIQQLARDGRDGLVDQSAPSDDAEIRRRVDFRDAIRDLADYVDMKLETFDADPSVGALLSYVQPLVLLWDDDYRNPALRDRS